MAKVLMRDIGGGGACITPPAMAADEATVREIIAGEDAQIHLHVIEAEPGASWTWLPAGHGRLAYVLEGSVESAGTRIATGGTITIEQHGTARATAIDKCRLVMFTAHGQDPRAGGHAHLLAAERVPRANTFGPDKNIGGALFMDADCPTCSMWLHENSIPQSGFETAVHAHSEDEVILVTAGNIVLGARSYGPGTALAIARDTLYGFRTGEEGLTFINFRPAAPTYYQPGKPEARLDERAHFLAHTDAPRPVTIPG